MQNYPLSLVGKLIAFNPQVKITDASGRVVMYVKQKALALKEDVRVFTDEGQQHLLYQIRADRRIDFSARYTITTPDGRPVGQMQREGMKSLWKATYHVLDGMGNPLALIHEENPWMKVLDGLLSDVPFVGMFINPAYLIDVRGQTGLYLKKEPSFMERKFTIEQRGPFGEEEEEVLLASIIMMMMLEKERG